MTDKQIIIDDYFNIMHDENGKIFGIQEIGDPKSLIKTIREQNEYIQAKEQECEELKETIDDFITDNTSLYCYDGKQPSDLYELQECMQSSMNEFVKYKQALDEIEKLAKENVELLEGYHLEQANCLTILEIINQAKEGE